MKLVKFMQLLGSNGEEDGCLSTGVKHKTTLMYILIPLRGEKGHQLSKKD